jgi:tol-pal system protein YbgF
MIRSGTLLAIALVGALGAPNARAQDSPSDIVTRIDRMQETIRDLTGSIEQLQYRNQQLEQQVQRLQAEVEGGAHPAASAAPQRPSPQYAPPPQQPPGYPPSQQYPQAQTSYPPPSAQYTPPSPPYSPPPPAPMASAAPVEAPPATGRRGDAFDPNANPTAPGAPRALGTSTTATEPPPPVADNGGRQPGVPLDLSGARGGAPGGPLPPPPPINPSATGATVATLPPSNSPKDAYDLGYGYFLHKDYGQAAATFTAFLRQYPSDRLAPDAQYWLGESLFQNQQYHDAAEAFLALSTKYETTARAPDALLRLGESLAALGEKEAACASLGEVLRKYPRASLNVKQSVDREQKRAHC